MARLALLPDDIIALLARHPELELELATKATEQVADGLSRRITHDLVGKRIDQELDRIVTERINWKGERKLTAEYQRLVAAEARGLAKEAFGAALSGEVSDAIREQVRNSMPGVITMAREEIRKDLRNTSSARSWPRSC